MRSLTSRCTYCVVGYEIADVTQHLLSGGVWDGVAEFVELVEWLLYGVLVQVEAAQCVHDAAERSNHHVLIQGAKKETLALA